MDSYFIPRISIAFELQKFRQTSPLPGENIEKFVFRLRKLARNCELGNQTEKLIVNQIMSTTKDMKLKAKILKSDLSLSDVIATARANDSLQLQLEQCGSSEIPRLTEENILKISTTTRQPNETTKNYPIENLRNYKQQRCTRCNGRHSFKSEKCPARNETCHVCKVVGHFARCCNQVKKKHNTIEPVNQTKSNMRRKKYIREIEKVSDAEAEEFDVFHLNSEKRTAVVSVGGATMKFIIDTGADVDVLCDRDWQMLKQTGFVAYGVRKGSSKVFKAYGTNNHLKVLGEVDTEIMWKEKTVETTLYVIEGGKCSLLSGETAEELGILVFVQTLDMAFPHMKGNI